MGQFFDELKRRNVIRVAIAYVVASWVLLQVADLVLDNIVAPDWVMQVFMLALALGFPLVLLFSWIFELTPEGLKREKDVEHSESVTRRTAHKLDRVTVVLLVVVLLVFAADRLAPHAVSGAAEDAAAADTSAGQSIAVLAFDDLSPAGDQAYFAEGISEELLNVLAQTPGLKVAGRTSSFAFKDQDRDLREIGEILEVDHILEGSVRTSGNRVRVTAQLVKAADGFHLFSRNYDRELTDIFEVQDDIAREISTALRTAILGEDAADRIAPTEPEAYERFLRARQWIHTRDRQLMEQASAQLDEALAIDPDYAPALAQKALVTILLSDASGSYGDTPLDDASAIARPLLDRALAIDPQLADAYAILGLVYSVNSIGYSEEASVNLRRALDINPTMTNATNWLAQEAGDGVSIAESRRLYERVVEHDPLYTPAFNNLTFSYMQTRDLDKADALIRRVQRITGDSPGVHFARGTMAMANGDLSTAMRELGESYDFNPSASNVQLWYSAAAQYVGDFERAVEVARPTDKLVPLELSGRHDEAEAVLASLAGTKFGNGEFRAISEWFLLQDRAADLVAFHENYYGDRGDWIDNYPEPDNLWGASSFTGLALALRKSGREDDAQRVLERALRIVAEQRENGADNLFFWYNDAELGALTGDRQRMLTAMRNAIDTGMIRVLGFSAPSLERYRSDARFIELENEAIRRGNEERRELGMLAM